MPRRVACGGGLGPPGLPTLGSDRKGKGQFRDRGRFIA
jgi:hypothetical protein